MIADYPTVFWDKNNLSLYLQGFTLFLSNRIKEFDTVTPVSEIQVSTTTSGKWHPVVHKLSFATYVGGSSGLIPLVLLLGSKTLSFALRTGLKREASPRPHEMCFSSHISILACTSFIFQSCSYLFCVPGMPSHSQTPVLSFPWFSQNWGSGERGRRTFVQKV